MLRRWPTPTTLAGQLGWRLGLIILLLLAVLSVLAYGGAQALATERLGLHLSQQVAQRALQLGQPLEEGERSVQRLHAEWQRRAGLGPPPTPVLRQRFDALFAREADGVWRLRPEHVDPLLAPTFYLQHGEQGPDDDVRWRALVSHQLLLERGPALVPPHFSAYVDFVERGLMVYSRGIDWGRGATPQTNNFDYPTMQGSDPQRNPERKLFWTPVYFDGEARTWMVSVIQPLDWRGRWVGTVGHDLALDALQRSVRQHVGQGFTVMVFNPQGELVAHSELAERIAQAQGQLGAGASGDPVAQEAWALLQRDANAPAGKALSADGRRIVAWHRMPGPGWWAVEVAEVSVINDSMHRFGPAIVAGGLLALLLGTWLQGRLVRRRVHQPLAQLGAAIETLRSDALPAPVGWQGDDELARIGQAFDRMAQELGERRVAERAHAQALEREVQERQQAEAALRALNGSLEQRIGERTAELQGLNQGLQASLAQLRQAQAELVQKETLAGLGSLVAGVAHELNTPLGNALLAASSAQEALVALRDELGSGRARRSEVERLNGEIERATGLVLSALSRSVDLVSSFKRVAVDRAGLQRRPFRLREVTSEVLDLLAIAHKRQPYRFEVDLPEDVELDSLPGAYGQVITNLVENALVHGLAGRPAGCVRIALRERAAEHIVLTVQDDGHGIPEAHRASVFRPFFTTRLGQGGSGLGLHIVYTLVTGALGGRIEVESRMGEGTCFVLQLPLRAPNPD